MRIFYPFGFRPGAAGGGATHVRQFISHIERLGVSVVTLRGDASRGDPGYPKSRLARLRTLRGVDAIYERLEHRAPSGGWYRNPQRLLIGRPLVAWELNTVPEYATVLGGGIADVEREKHELRRLAPRCDVAFCVSAALAAYARRELGIGRAVTVPNGSDPERFAPGLAPVARLRAHAGQVNVVWIGSADLDWHDFDLLRRAAAAVGEAPGGERVVFHVLGHGLPGVAEMPANVHYHGAVPYDELPRWLAGCQIGLIAYRSGPADYSSPLKLFDYLASGLAVVSTEQPQVREVLSQIGGEAQLVPHGDAAAFAAAILALAAAPERRAALAAAGRRLVEQRYTWRHNAEAIRTELAALLAARAR